MYKGSCLCGSVRFEIKGEIRNIVFCHCSQCRRVQGSAFATNGIVMAEDFVFLSGEEVLTTYEDPPGHKKLFCSQCGSPIMSKRDSAPDQVRVRLGTIVSDIKERPGAHIFATSKANWDEITDDLPQYDGYEPDR